MAAGLFTLAGAIYFVFKAMLDIGAHVQKNPAAYETARAAPRGALGLSLRLYEYIFSKEFRLGHTPLIPELDEHRQPNAYDDMIQVRDIAYREIDIKFIKDRNKYRTNADKNFPFYWSIVLSPFLLWSLLTVILTISGHLSLPNYAIIIGIIAALPASLLMMIHLARKFFEKPSEIFIDERFNSFFRGRKYWITSGQIHTGGKAHPVINFCEIEKIVREDAWEYALVFEDDTNTREKLPIVSAPLQAYKKAGDADLDVIAASLTATLCEEREKAIAAQAR